MGNMDKGNKSASSADDPLMTSQQVMNYLQIKRTKLWQLIKNEGLPKYQLGAKGEYRFRKSEIDDWLLRQMDHDQSREG